MLGFFSESKYIFFILRRSENFFKAQSTFRIFCFVHVRDRKKMSIKFANQNKNPPQASPFKLKGWFLSLLNARPSVRPSINIYLLTRKFKLLIQQFQNFKSIAVPDCCIVLFCCVFVRKSLDKGALINVNSDQIKRLCIIRYVYTLTNRLSTT